MNVRSVVAACALGAGKDQLAQFCAILGLSRLVHNKTLVAIVKKVHLAATKTVTENFEQARKLTAEDEGLSNSAVMFDRI